MAVLFADKAPLIGIKLDQTSLAGYVALGFIVSYLGIGTLLDKLTPTGSNCSAVPPPKLSSLDPRTGTKTTPVTLSGTGFQTETAVMFGTARADSQTKALAARPCISIASFIASSHPTETAFAHFTALKGPLHY